MNAREEAVDVLAATLFEFTWRGGTGGITNIEWKDAGADARAVYVHRAMAQFDALLASGVVVLRDDLEHGGWLRGWPDGTSSLLEHKRDERCRELFVLRGED